MVLCVCPPSFQCLAVDEPFRISLASGEADIGVGVRDKMAVVTSFRNLEWMSLPDHTTRRQPASLITPLIPVSGQGLSTAHLRNALHSLFHHPEKSCVDTLTPMSLSALVLRWQS